MDPHRSFDAQEIGNANAQAYDRQPSCYYKTDRHKKTETFVAFLSAGRNAT